MIFKKNPKVPRSTRKRRDISESKVISLGPITLSDLQVFEEELEGSKFYLRNVALAGGIVVLVLLAILAGNRSSDKY